MWASSLYTGIAVRMRMEDPKSDGNDPEPSKNLPGIHPTAKNRPRHSRFSGSEVNAVGEPPAGPPTP